MNADDGDWLAAERARHGPITEDEIHQSADALLDAWVATRAAEKAPRWAVTRTDI